jgi:predicted metal-dependent RNase
VVGDFEGCHVDHVDHVVISASHIEHSVVVAKLHISGTVGCRDPLDYLVIVFGVDHCDVARFLVTDEYIAGVSRPGLRRQDEP